MKLSLVLIQDNTPQCRWGPEGHASSRSVKEAPALTSLLMSKS